jgi:hypothetical protein
MHYLLNKNLSLGEKGLMALLLHLHEGGIKLTNKTIEHYCEYYLTPIEAVELLLPLRVLGYIEIIKDGDEARISIVREDNEIKE